MNLQKIQFHFPEKYWGYSGLALWAMLCLLVFRHDHYDLNEGAAKALLLTWSITDQVASSVVTFGTPDLRVLLYLPIGFLWTGNVFAAKVLTTLLFAGAAWLLYIWKRQASNSESALLSTGLLLISPLALSQIDSLSPGVYLLIAFAFGAWIDKIYRAAPRSFGGWYFAQLITSAFCISLHPAGLAYPLTLLWSWRTESLDNKQQKYFLIGISSTALLMLVISMGWRDLAWFQDPLPSLGLTLIPSSPLLNGKSTIHIVAGILVLLLLATTLAKQFSTIRNDLFGRTLLFALAIGAFSADSAWALIALSILLFFGLPLLLKQPAISSHSSFIKQRGAALAVLFILSLSFMQADRIHYESSKKGALFAQDQLIKTFADEAEKIREANEVAENDESKVIRIRVASQWPSRTMIACKCDTLPLPPAAASPSAQLDMMRSITHLLLDPKQTSNLALVRNLSLLGGVVETSSLQAGGVILHIKEAEKTRER